MTALVAGLVAIGCVSHTPYRREALVPGPQAPAWTGEPTGKGHVDIQGQVTVHRVEERYIDHPDYDLNEYDASLWIPTTQLSLSVMGGVTSFLDLGASLTWAHGTWASRSTVETPPRPEDDNWTLTVGPQIAMGGTSKNGLFFGGAYVSVQYARVPWSEWEHLYDGSYRLISQDVDHKVLYRIGFFAGIRPARWVAVHVGLVLGSCWLNDGFSDEPKEGSTVEDGTPVVMPLSGVRFDVGRMFFETSVTFPISSEDAVRFVPMGLSIGIGVRI